MIDVSELKAKNPCVSVIGSYTKLTRAGNTYRGKCPVHGGEHDNLVVYPDKDTWHCFSCNCHDGHADQIGFLELMLGTDFKGAAEYLGAQREWKPELVKPARPPQPARITSKPPPDAGMPRMAIKGLGEPVATWEYKDFDGGTLGYVARYETEAGKEIRCWSWGSRGADAAAWGCGHFSKPRPCFHLERLKDYPDKPVLITEGEKACDAAQLLLSGYVCITWHGGAQAWKHADFSPLSGKTVLLWPDNDAIGIDCMQKLAQVLVDPAGLACKVRIIDPSGQEPGADAADWIGTTAELIAWAKPRASDVLPLVVDHEKRNVINENIGETAVKQAISSTSEHNSSAAQEPPSLKPGATSPFPPPAAPSLEPDTGPTSDLPPEPPPTPGTTPERPPRAATRARRPRLAAVEGNAVPESDQDSEILPLSLSDDGIATEFAAVHQDNFRYVAKTDSWYAWDGCRWAMEEHRSRIWTAARALSRALKYRADAHGLTAEGKKRLESYKNIASFLNLVKVDSRIVASPDQWDTDPYLLGIPGGVIDLKLGKEIEPERDQYISKQTAVRPEPGGCPHWMAVLNRQTKGDQGLEWYIQRWCFYILTGSVQEQCFMAVFGPGASGKSTFVHVLGDILGDYAQAANMEAFMSRDRPEHSTELARMAGARLITATETEEGARLNEARVKVLTGNDRISARFMRQDQFDFTPSAKIILAGNHRPSLKSVGEEMRRRVHLVEFPDTIPEDERNRSLPDLLKAEYPQILHWMLQGREWLETGLGKPESVTHSTDRYLENEDTFGAWLLENAERNATARERAGTVYTNYHAWCEANGDFAVSQKRFAQQLESRGFVRVRPGGVRHFQGLKLKPRDDERSPPPSYDRD